MRKLEKRAILCLLMALILALGMCLFVFRFVRDGDKWATFHANEHIYKNGYLSIGTIYDRNGMRLAANGLGPGGRPRYAGNAGIRRATAHAVGDVQGNVSTSAEAVFKKQIVGYNPLTGTYSVTGRGNDVKLSISAKACRTAYNALGNHNGLVGVYNYHTGEILCMVSKPTFDPASPPNPNTAASGTFMNKFLSGRMAPGSIFKLVTSAAAIDTLPDLDRFQYYCTGSRVINGEKINCTAAHGQEDFAGALANSCNCAFSVLADRIGAKTMARYAKKCGLTTSYDISGVRNAPGVFEFPSNSTFNLGWAGIGQWKDQLNPCSMMVYMGGIASGGTSVVPKLVHHTVASVDHTDRMLSTSTANRLKRMMKNNVRKTYGTRNFPGLDIYAKSGTAEVANQRPNAWFSGFIADKGHPYAFIVCVENSGTGANYAAPVANKVLQELVNE
ncbi:penicillin-binding transpeptidase domain-containing protein [Eubacterium pyruvativorans]|uniref:penicillin-binding transpeptidase domain-containing protein n=1 Tax=Eubacterium pyruvativorans TaxID=155865 RepID=UPI0023F434A9|nr:penicillin-binding transpeptidase domain-containing protein [Eubacterium pyruvativorans]MDD7684091.1 penicillin-binding transpeptidase domain-containing protein [Eubacterium pyruvativorans]